MLPLMDKRSNVMGIWVAMGIVIGAALGVATDNAGVGISMGLVIGAAIGAAQSGIGRK